MLLMLMLRLLLMLRMMLLLLARLLRRRLLLMLQMMLLRKLLLLGGTMCMHLCAGMSAHTRRCAHACTPSCARPNRRVNLRARPHGRACECAHTQVCARAH